MKRTIVSAVSKCTMFVQPGDAVLEAARMMCQAGCSYAVVGSEDRLMGLITAADIVQKVVAVGGDPARTPVEWVMTRPLCAKADMLVGHAIYMMKEFGIEYFPVVDTERRPLGIFRLCDSLPTELESAKVLAIAKHRVYGSTSK